MASFERWFQALWCCLQAAIKEYVGSDAHKKERRDIDKQLTKVTQQISGTGYIVSLSAALQTVLMAPQTVS